MVMLIYLIIFLILDNVFDQVHLHPLLLAPPQALCSPSS